MELIHPDKYTLALRPGIGGGSGCRVSGTPGVQGALMELIHPDKYTLALRPGIGDWTIAGY